MHETLLEICDWQGPSLRVDREAGVIHGVKILGSTSKNHRTYPHETLERAKELYEGIKVNVNHPKGSPTAPRDYQDRLGTLRHVVFRRNEGLFGDLFYNPKHPLAEQLIWDADHAPENVGLSHNVQARTRVENGQVVVEEIVQVQGVDLVADPATTKGLFEGLAGTTTGRLPGGVADERTTQGELTRLREELDRYRLAESRRQRDHLIDRLLREHRLPGLAANDPWASAVLSEEFLEELRRCENDDELRRKIADRARLVEAVRSENRFAPPHPQRPRAREQWGSEAHFAQPETTADFVRAIVH